jgi:hypothetical protein
MAKRKAGVKLPIWLPTTKNWESPWVPCMTVACHIPLKRFWRGLQIFFRIHLDRRSKKKLWVSKVVGIPILGILGLQLGSPMTKWHLGAGPVAKHKLYYKGEGGASPNSKLWWVLWVRVYPWFVHALKMLQLCTNQFVVWFVQVRSCE